MLTITLDESDSFAAWVAAKDAGFTNPDGSDPKCKVVLVHSVKCICYKNSLFDRGLTMGTCFHRGV